MPLTEVGNFSVSFLQVLDENGNLDQALEPRLGESDLLKLHRGMSLGRELDQRMLKLQRQGRLGTFAPTTGQEAAICGPALAMSERDWFIPAFRETPGMIMRGVPVLNILQYYNGYEEGNVFGQGNRALPISIIVGSQMLHAVGIAYALKLRKEKDTAAVAFFGDGATSEGDFHEALNFAGVWQVPVVFICQNNQWAISLPREKQSRSKTLAQKALAYGIAGLQVDGNDVLAMYRATHEALDRAYAGDGPTLIEAVTYRLLMHTTSDDPRKYRSEEEETQWRKRDPLPRFTKYLQDKGILNEQRIAEIEQEIKNEVNAAAQQFEAKTDFKPDAPFDHVFGTKHDLIEEQRAEFLKSLELEKAHG